MQSIQRRNTNILEKDRGMMSVLTPTLILKKKVISKILLRILTFTLITIRERI